MIIKNARVFVDGLFEEKTLEVTNGIFTNILDTISTSKLESHIVCHNAKSSIKPPMLEDCNEDIILDFSDKYIIPGLIDVHSHGCMGYDFIHATEKEIETMCHFYASKGITSILATTMTIHLDTHINAMKTIAKAIESTNHRSRILGINMEGPFLGKDKKGAHDPDYLIDVSEDIFIQLYKASNENILLVDLDPTLPRAMDFIKKYKDTVTISLAHTSSTYDTALKAFESGASHVTHLFNAMNGLHHREPGIVGAFCDCHHEVRAELICDGIHVHPSVIRLIYKASSDSLILISDSMCAAGLEDGEYELGGQKVIVKDMKATLLDGTIAGSTVNVYDAMKRAISFGIPKEQAILSATLIPATSIKQENKVGSIALGKYADFIVTDKDFNIEHIYIGGKEFKS